MGIQHANTTTYVSNFLQRISDEALPLIFLQLAIQILVPLPQQPKGKHLCNGDAAGKLIFSLYNI